MDNFNHIVAFTASLTEGPARIQLKPGPVNPKLRAAADMCVKLGVEMAADIFKRLKAEDQTQAK